MIDFVSYLDRFPKDGETLHGNKFKTSFGGKGANQMVAAAKLGANCVMIARVGDDIWGDNYIKNFEENCVDTTYVKKAPDSHNGVAQILVNAQGMNMICIVAGANLIMNVDDVMGACETISTAAVVMVQLECKIEVAVKALELCNGVSILNGAPGLKNADPKLFKLPSIFCVNESEASMFTGITVKTVEDAKKACTWLINKGARMPLITLGSLGSVYAFKEKPNEIKHIPPTPIQSIDSTGAGDCFIGALAFMLVYRADLPMEDKVKAAGFIAADACTRAGAQASYPGEEILRRCF